MLGFAKTPEEKVRKKTINTWFIENGSYVSDPFIFILSFNKIFRNKLKRLKVRRFRYAYVALSSYYYKNFLRKIFIRGGDFYIKRQLTRDSVYFGNVYSSSPSTHWYSFAWGDVCRVYQRNFINKL